MHSLWRKNKKKTFSTLHFRKWFCFLKCLYWSCECNAKGYETSQWCVAGLSQILTELTSSNEPNRVVGLVQVESGCHWKVFSECFFSCSARKISSCTKHCSLRLMYFCDCYFTLGWIPNWEIAFYQNLSTDCKKLSPLLYRYSRVSLDLVAWHQPTNMSAWSTCLPVRPFWYCFILLSYKGRASLRYTAGR